MPRVSFLNWFFVIVLTYACTCGFVIAREPELVKIKPLDYRETDALVHWSKIRLTFVAYSMVYFDAISRHEHWDATNRALLEDVLKQLKNVHDEMPEFEELFGSGLPEPLSARRTQLIDELGKREGTRQFSLEQYDTQIAKGKIVTLPQQQEAVWKIIDSLDGKLPEFEEIKAAFLIAVLVRTGPALIAEDPYISRQLGLDALDVNAAGIVKEETRKEYLRQLNDAKCRAVTEVWNVLTLDQQEKLCRLLGQTKRVILLEPTNSSVDLLCRELRAEALQDIASTPDAIRLLLDSEFVANQDWLVRQNARLTERQMKDLGSLIDKALSGERGRFRDKTSQQSWLASVDQQLQPVIQSLKHDKREEAKELMEDLNKLMMVISKYRGNPPTLEERRSKTPMIFFLTEFDVLDDAFVEKKHLASKNSKPTRMQLDNYLPFMPENPYAGREEPPDDAMVTQFRQAEDLHRRWVSERRTAKDYSALIAINNRYLLETKEIMLPFQYGEVFKNFFNLYGPVAMFRFHDVAEEFNMSDTQRNRLRDAGSRAANELEQSCEMIQRAALKKVFVSIVEKKARSLESAFGANEDRLIELLMIDRDEREFLGLFAGNMGQRFNPLRLYKHPYSLGISY